MALGDFTLAGFAAHLAGLAAQAEHHEREGLKAATGIVREEAKDSLGGYQDAAGPFAAWAPLAEATKDERARLGFTPDDPLKRTGRLRDAIEDSVEDGVGTVGVKDAEVGTGEPGDPVRNIGDVARDMELGTEHAPPRSFLGGALVRRAPDAVEAAARVVVGGLFGAGVVGAGMVGGRSPTGSEGG